MANTGEDLEALVRAIEERLLPAGFKVEPRKRIYLEGGKQLAEFDIHITGVLGSSSIKWDIECRDRPSDGPAEGEWIEQLIGRRQAHGFDKVFAVSTTGFSPGAREIAARSGIVLRTVITMSDIVDDFEIMEIDLGLSHHQVELLAPIYIDAVEPATIPRDYLGNFFVRGRLRGRGEHKYVPFVEYVLSHTATDVYNPVHDAPSQLYLAQPGWTNVLLGRDEMRLHNLIMWLEIRKITTPAHILTARQYVEGERLIAREGDYQAESMHGAAHWHVRIIDHQDGRRDIFVTPVGATGNISLLPPLTITTIP